MADTSARPGGDGSSGAPARGAVRGRGSRARRLPLALTVLAALAVAGWIASSYVVAFALTARTARPAREPLPSIPGVQIEELTLATTDGEMLGAWLVPGQPALPVVVLLHGRGGSRSARVAVLRLLAEAGHGVLAVSLRGHGDSSGERIELGPRARHDVVAAVGALETRWPGRPIVVCGTSLGAAAAAFAAAELEARVDGYVLECLYRDLPTAIRRRTALYLPPVLDEVAYAGLMLAGRAVLGADPASVAPIEALRAVPPSVPVLLLAGGRDRRATVAEAIELRDAAGGRSALVVFEHAEHEALHASDPERYRRVLLQAVAGSVPDAETPTTPASR